jgi:hypothetical protein
MPVSYSNIDFIAHDRDGHVLLLAEAKSRRGTSASWAAGLRRNMLSHGMLPASKYFLVATPERLYLWRQEDSHAAEALPQVTIDAEKVLAPYFKVLRQDPSQIGPEAFEHLVLAWLKDLARPELSGADQNARQGDGSLLWLAELSRSLQAAEVELTARS